MQKEEGIALRPVYKADLQQGHGPVMVLRFPDLKVPELPIQRRIQGRPQVYDLSYGPPSEIINKELPNFHFNVRKLNGREISSKSNYDPEIAPTKSPASSHK